jgi:hypothetical protein
MDNNAPHRPSTQPRRSEPQLSHAPIGQPDDRPDSACPTARRMMGMQ